jgi:hypothetical protein
MITGFWGWISAGVAVTVALVIAGLALAILWALFKGTINLTYLLAEPADPRAQRDDPDGNAPPETPKASLARFQFLIFTFVIAGVYLVLCLEAGRFVEIPDNVILLLGVSGTSYAASKGIKAAADSRRPDPGPANG